VDWLDEYTRHSPPGNRPAHWPAAGSAVTVVGTSKEPGLGTGVGFGVPLGIGVPLGTGVDVAPGEGLECGGWAAAGWNPITASGARRCSSSIQRQAMCPCKYAFRKLYDCVSWGGPVLKIKVDGVCAPMLDLQVTKKFSPDGERPD
jgi:hypothetical protein